MGFLRSIYQVFIAVIFLTLGILLFIYPVTDIVQLGNGYYDQLITQAPALPIDNINYRQIAGIIILLYGLVKLWMGLGPKHRIRAVTFLGTHGEVTIELEPVETTLQRVAMKLPEVKNISITLTPLEGNGRILVDAIAILEKGAEDDARMITARIQNFLQIHTRKIVGLQEVEAKLRVKRWHMKMKTVKIEPLLLESDQKENEATPQKSTHRSETPQVMVTPIPDEVDNSLTIESSQEQQFGKL